jgi:hypothetical protein
LIAATGALYFDPGHPRPAIAPTHCALGEGEGKGRGKLVAVGRLTLAPRNRSVMDELRNAVRALADDARER